MADITFTQEAFVNAAESSAQAILEDYKIMIKMGLSETDATEVAVDQARQAASCYAGAGLCGGGGCKHA